MITSSRYLELHDDHVRLAEDLLTALHTANALSGYFAREHGGAWGAIKESVILTLTCAITAGYAPIFWEDARQIATRIYSEAIDNGEDLRYNIDLWNQGVISL